mgnify:CR=1 FL=1
MKNFEYGTHFIYQNREYIVVGEDTSRNEIECQTVPCDNEFYWFKIFSDNKIFKVNRSNTVSLQ